MGKVRANISTGCCCTAAAAASGSALAHPGGPFWAGRDAGAWTIPKGLAEPGEDLLAAARREFRGGNGLEPRRAVRPAAERPAEGREGRSRLGLRGGRRPFATAEQHNVGRVAAGFGEANRVPRRLTAALGLRRRKPARSSTRRRPPSSTAWRRPWPGSRRTDASLLRRPLLGPPVLFGYAFHFKRPFPPRETQSVSVAGWAQATLHSGPDLPPEEPSCVCCPALRDRCGGCAHFESSPPLPTRSRSPARRRSGRGSPATTSRSATSTPRWWCRRSRCPGRPWVWRGEFFGAFADADVALVKAGWHLAYLKVPDLFGSPEGGEEVGGVPRRDGQGLRHAPEAGADRPLAGRAVLHELSNTPCCRRLGPVAYCWRTGIAHKFRGSISLSRSAY